MNLIVWIRGATKALGKFTVKNASHILMGLGTGCSIAAIISAVKVTPAAKEAKDDKIVDVTLKCVKNNDKDMDIVTWDDCEWAIMTGKINAEKLSAKDYLQLFVKYYGIAFVMEILALACFWTAHGIDIKRQAVLAGLAATAEEALREYQKKVQEMIGEKAEKEVQNAVAQDKVDRLPPPPDKNPSPPGSSPDWCIIKNGDWISPYFLNTYVGIKDAENMINHEMIQNMYASETDLFWHLDPDRRWLKSTGTSGQCGWNVDRLLELDVTKCDGPDHETVLVICYKDKNGMDNPPRPQFDMLA